MTDSLLGRRPRVRISPRLLVVGLAMLVLLPLLITAVIARRGASTSEARVTSERLALAQSTALSTGSWVESQLATLRTLARSPDIRDLGNRPNLRGVLDQALVDMPDWESVEVYQESGELITGVGASGPSNVDRPSFQAALTDGRPVVGPAVPGRREGYPAVPLMVPVDFINGASGVMVVLLSTARLSDALSSVDRDDGLQIAVLDRQSNVIVRAGAEPVRGVASSIESAETSAAMAGAAGAARVKGEDGSETLTAYAPVPGVEWVVLVTQPVSVAFEAIRRQLRDQLLLLACAGGLIGMITLFLGERLARSYERQIEAMARVDQFISSASHDLKTPLTAIKTLAQLMQRRVDRTAIQDGEWFRDGLSDIDNQTNRMSGQIDELLDLSRFGRAEPVELRRRPTDLVRVVRRVAADQQKLSNRHQIRIEPSVPEITGQWDPERIERVVANLLGNALKYSPSGGEITVRISRERTTGLGDCAVLTVQDQGLGIPPDDLPFVFDQYRRGSNVTGRIAGSGIGLAGVRRIVEEHGGSIVAESEEGKGSCFTVRLPLEPLSTASTL